jgi:chromosome segregation ATPase
MSSLDDIPDQFQQLVDRARAALDAQVTKARKIVDSLNAEKTAAVKSLGELKLQIEKAEAELEAVRADLGRTSSAVRLDREIAKSRKESEQLTVENAEAAKALEARLKQCAEAEARVVALEIAARQATAERCRAQEIIEAIKRQLQSAPTPRAA